MRTDPPCSAWIDTAALRFGDSMARMVVPFLLSDERIARREPTQGHAETEAVAQYAAITCWLCELAEMTIGTGGRRATHQSHVPTPGTP
jgi:hypothetical protein